MVDGRADAATEGLRLSGGARQEHSKANLDGSLEACIELACRVWKEAS